ncbi:MAG: hypothetical protein Q8O72_07855 [Bacteroidales bacterium]|nr:hypothetical protein [Bacteroidales bacterium]
MSKIANVYSNAVKNHFRVLYANWEPGTPIELGDYGKMDGNVFIPMGKLKNDFPEFKKTLLKTTSDTRKDTKEFKSESGVEVNLLPKGSLSVDGVPLAKATLDIKFSGKNTVYFNAIGCTNTRITNKAKLGEALMEKFSGGHWEKKYYVVTDLVEADKAIIAISKSGRSGISFEAESPLLQKIDLSDASIKLDLKMEKDIGYKVPAEEGLTLLLGLCKIESRFFSRKIIFEPKTRKGLGFGERLGLESDIPDFEVEDFDNLSGIPLAEMLEEELVFQQMGEE